MSDRGPRGAERFSRDREIRTVHIDGAGQRVVILVVLANTGADIGANQIGIAARDDGNRVGGGELSIGIGGLAGSGAGRMTGQRNTIETKRNRAAPARRARPVIIGDRGHDEITPGDDGGVAAGAGDGAADKRDVLIRRDQQIIAGTDMSLGN